MGDPQRILIVRPSALGDVCRTVGVLVSLRQAFPAARIDWAVQEEFAPAIRAHPALDEVVARHGGYIRQETLSRKLAQGAPDEWAYAETHDINGLEAVLGVQRE